MEKKQLRVMKKVPETDLTPYKDVILAENQASLLLSPALPRAQVSSSSASIGLGPDAVAPPAVPVIPSLKVGLANSLSFFRDC